MTEEHHIAQRSPQQQKLPDCLKDRVIVLVGLMGAGKSTGGRRLARTLGLPFYDSDQEVSEAAGCSISDLFAVHGEDIFRDLEERVILRLLTRPPAVLATGGGAFMNPVIRQAIQEQAVSVWLRADIEILVERVSRRNTRPLLENGDKRSIMTRLIEERSPIYSQASVVVDSDSGAHEGVVEKIISRLEQHLTGKAPA